MADGEIILRDLLEKVFEKYKDDIRVKALTSGGGNYTSALFKIDIPNDGAHLKLFGKVAIVSEQLRNAINAEVLYSTEQYVYANLIQMFNDIEDKHGIPVENRFKFPKCYGRSPKLGEETIILEDLTENGYSTYSRFKSVDWEHSKTSVATMAKLHSFSFACRKEQPEMYDSLIEKFMVKHYTVRDENTRLMVTINDNAIAIIDDEGNKTRLKNFLKADESSNAYMEFKKPLDVPVLTHGDYRLSNLLFRRLVSQLEYLIHMFSLISLCYRQLP